MKNIVKNSLIAILAISNVIHAGDEGYSERDRENARRYQLHIDRISRRPMFNREVENYCLKIWQIIKDMTDQDFTDYSKNSLELLLAQQSEIIRRTVRFKACLELVQPRIAIQQNFLRELLHKHRFELGPNLVQQMLTADKREGLYKTSTEIREEVQRLLDQRKKKSMLTLKDLCAKALGGKTSDDEADSQPALFQKQIAAYDGEPQLSANFITSFKGGAQNVAISPHQQLIAASSRTEQKIAILNTRTNNLIVEIPFDKKERITSIAFTSDSKELLICKRNNTATAYTYNFYTIDSREMRIVKSRTPAEKIAFCQNDTYIIVQHSGRMAIKDATTLENVYSHPANQFVVNNEGTQCYFYHYNSATNKSLVYQYDISNKQLHQLGQYDERVMDLTTSPNGTLTIGFNDHITFLNSPLYKKDLPTYHISAPITSNYQIFFTDNQRILLLDPKAKKIWMINILSNTMQEAPFTYPRNVTTFTLGHQNSHIAIITSQLSATHISRPLMLYKLLNGKTQAVYPENPDFIINLQQEFLQGLYSVLEAAKDSMMIPTLKTSIKSRVERYAYDFIKLVNKRQCTPSLKEADSSSSLCEDDEGDSTLISLLPVPKPIVSTSSLSSSSSGSSSSYYVETSKDRLAAQRGQKRDRPEEPLSEDVALQIALEASRAMQPSARPLTIGESLSGSPRIAYHDDDDDEDDYDDYDDNEEDYISSPRKSKTVYNDHRDWYAVQEDDPDDPKGKGPEKIIAYRNKHTGESITPEEHDRRFTPADSYRSSSSSSSQMMQPSAQDDYQLAQTHEANNRIKEDTSMSFASASSSSASKSGYRPPMPKPLRRQPKPRGIRRPIPSLVKYAPVEDDE